MTHGKQPLRASDPKAGVAAADIRFVIALHTVSTRQTVTDHITRQGDSSLSAAHSAVWLRRIGRPASPIDVFAMA